MESAFGGDVGRTCDRGSDVTAVAVDPLVAAGEGAADDAFLDVNGALLKRAVGGEAGETGAGAGAAGGAVIGASGAEDEVAVVGVWAAWQAVEDDVVDFGVALGVDCLADFPGEISEGVDVRALEGEVVIVHEEEP